MSRQRKAHAGTLLLALSCILGVLLAACGGGAANNPSSTPKNLPLLVDTGPTGDFTRNFNPFSAAALAPTKGTIYEPLLYTNMISGEIKPWLAASHKLADDAMSITFTLQSGTKWSDGKPLTADDVVFTFELMQKNPGLDASGVWKYLKSVVASDEKTITFTYNAPNSSHLYFIATKTYIVPKHIWSTVSDPVQFANPDPVGSGAFTLKTFTSQNITVVKNTNYWQPGKPEVPEVQFPASNDNAGIQLRLYSGKVDWTGIPARDVQRLYVDKDPEHNHYWFQPVDPNLFFVNLTKEPFNNLAVRQAISSALDRDQMSKIAEQGYEPVAHPTGIIPSLQKDYLDPQYANLTFTRDLAKTASLLEGAGYSKGPDGIYQKDGKKLSFKIDVAAGWSDWEALVQIAVQNLKEAGIEATSNTLGIGDYQSRMAKGQFDLSMAGSDQGPSPFYPYNGLLNSANTAPVGEAAVSNHGRWQDEKTDELLKQYATTIDPAKQKEAIYGLQKIMVEQLPVIPLLYDVTWAEYNSSKYEGWPTPDNPYAPAGNYFFPDLGYILLQLKPAS